MSNKMCKAELKDEVERLVNKVEALEAELAGLEEAYCELEEENYKLSNNIQPSGIPDLDRLKYRMQVDGVYTDMLWEYLENYLRFYI